MEVGCARQPRRALPPSLEALPLQGPRGVPWSLKPMLQSELKRVCIWACLRRPSPPEIFSTFGDSSSKSSAFHKRFPSVPAPPPQGFKQELHKLLALLPPHIKKRLEELPDLPQLVEIVLDLGRRPVARFPSGDFPLAEDVLTIADLEQAISLVGEFADDNRAGIDRTLHRISAIRNRAGRIVGLTCRVGRSISGSAEMARDLVERGGSLLLMGPPGVGKTTAIREIARLLADEYNKRVVIVDTSNEIAGDGDIPHAGIGRARRMQVPNVDMQHRVMIEAVENHMPETIVIDEIGTELEAHAAGTIAQRGVQLVATAHGISVENLIKNPSLQILGGGIQSVTLGDDEARRRGVQKSVLERKGPPTFTSAAEMISRTEWRIHHSLAATIDALLAGRTPLFEERNMNESGGFDCNVPLSEFSEFKYRPFDIKHGQGLVSGADSSTDDDEDGNDSEDDMFGSSGKTDQLWRPGDAPLLLYPFQISDSTLEHVVEVMCLEDAVQLTDDLGAADAVLALRSKLNQSSWVRGIAKYRQLPIFAIKANTMPQMVRALRTILGMESLASGNSLPSGRLKDDAKARSEGSGKGLNSSRKVTVEDEVDALEEARLAIEQIVIPKSQPVELLPRSVGIIASQIKLIESYQLGTETAGSESSLRIRILPYHLKVSTGISSIESISKSGDGVSEALGLSGTSVSRLPILPE
ncbi:hypothetical protein GOP47_0014943 [Adiantum capillus-veneris]|uniref:AAA+ ATPase domain-containing protein n=1 Tax=Adiantum capillus-veneris TaxID=13818 RepID=A0A9D4ZEQ5_ADICA|nr:hypothetical protein GOP47_0014943 [Adiantum capillus-veneris]